MSLTFFKASFHSSVPLTHSSKVLRTSLYPSKAS
nr:MAG TPA: hypothetical protein [Caudoviricetes sp.]DAT10109.1 MAG TPA: hypothetical protein [Caudoviricetes sp.]